MMGGKGAVNPPDIPQVQYPDPNEMIAPVLEQYSQMMEMMVINSEPPDVPEPPEIKQPEDIDWEAERARVRSDFMLKLEEEKKKRLGHTGTVLTDPSLLTDEEVLTLLAPELSGNRNNG